MKACWLNGTLTDPDQASVSVFDHGLLYGDGVFEGIRFYQGRPFRLDAHLQRLERSLAEVSIANPHDRAGWRRLCEEMVAANGGGNLSVYLQITRGVADKRDHAFPDPPVAPTVFLTSAPIPVPAADSLHQTRGAAAITLADTRWARCDIKSISLLPNILLRQQAVASGAVEAVLLREGLVTEGAASNVFTVHNGEVSTPPHSARILGGITRDLVVELCREHGIPVVEREIPEARLHDADEIWVSSSTKDVVPITRLNDRPVGDGRPGATWKTLSRHYIQFKRRLCGLD